MRGVKGSHPSRQSMGYTKRRHALAVFTAFLVFAGTVPAAGHGGPPLRLGTVEESSLLLVSRIVDEVLSEGKGLPVKMSLSPSPEDLRTSFREGKLDLIVEFPPRAWRELACPEGSSSAAAGEKVRLLYGKEFPEAWIGITEVVEGSPCRRAVILLRREIVSDLRYSLVRPALEEVIGNTAAADVEEISRKARGDVRRQRDVIREFLEGKGLL